MRMISLSDTHGFLPEILETFDLMLMPGDVCPVHNHTKSYQETWLETCFSKWVNGLPFKNKWSRVVMCAGNHDFCFESAPGRIKEKLSRATNGRLVYLEDNGYWFDIEEDGKMKGYEIYGTPICKQFGNWAFMRRELEKYYSNIPDTVDILITHDAPDINGLGLISLGVYAGENAGNDVLAKHVIRAHPRYLFCGHIHSGNHELTEIDGTFMANVSIMDENYVPTYRPIVVEYE